MFGLVLINNQANCGRTPQPRPAVRLVYDFRRRSSKVIRSILASRGFRNFANYRARILFHCGKLNLATV